MGEGGEYYGSSVYSEQESEDYVLLSEHSLVTPKAANCRTCLYNQILFAIETFHCNAYFNETNQHNKFAGGN